MELRECPRNKLITYLTILASCSVALATSNVPVHAATPKSSSHNRKLALPPTQSIVAVPPPSVGPDKKLSFSRAWSDAHAPHMPKRRGEPPSTSLWDDGLMLSSSGTRKEKKPSGESGSNDDDEEKKTLSQQVKEGKYGLIQDELYSGKVKRPGIISYMPNPEMPKDTVKTLGGLDEDEIWLAENHVLVLRGGQLPEDEDKATKWLPIDDYQAPRRQVKLPVRPKVPPPFPVQLSDGGPVEVIGRRGNGSELGNPFYPLFSNASAPFTPALSFVPVNSSKGTIQFKPIIIPEKVVPKPREEEPAIPFFPALPPGAVIVPPPSNRSDYDDDEDQSIYYPPPYSFVYKRENDTGLVPPGPLVPGIILPPPPDFFGPLEEKKITTVKEKYAKRVYSTTTRPVTTVRKTASYSVSTSPETTTRRTKASSPKPSTFSRYSPKTALRKPISNASLVEKNALFVPRTVVVQVTTPSPVKHTTFKNYGIVGNQIPETSTEKEQWAAVVSNKAVPLLAAFYATTTPATPVNQQQQPHFETTPPGLKDIGPTRLPDQTSYFFYGEPGNEATSVRNNEETSTVYYKVEEPLNASAVKLSHLLGLKQQQPPQPQPHQQEQEEPFYNRVENSPPPPPPPPPPQQKQTTIKLLGSLIKDPLYHGSQIYFSSATPSSQQNSFYQESRQKNIPKPIYQYSFESADYQVKHEQLDKKKRKNKKQQSERQVSYDYQDEDIVQSVNEFEYQSTDSISEHQVQTNRLPYFPVTTPTSRLEVSSTLEPHRAYFTKQDEQLLDDVTKEYFTMFGKKLTGKRAQSTTPIYAKVNSVTESPRFTTSRYKAPKVKVHYGGQSRPFSLESDTLLNYRRPLPLINPDSEFITVIGPEQTRTAKLVQQPILGQDYGVRPVLETGSQVRDFGEQRILQQEQQQRNQDLVPMEGPRQLNPRPVSLGSDVNVNYQNPRPPINPEAELIGPITGHRENPSSYFAYSLPGNAGHVYFLTPQVSHRSNPGFLYSPRRTRQGP